LSGVGIFGAFVVGVLAGWLAERIISRRHGLLINLCVGLSGSFIGAWGAQLIGWQFHGLLGSLLVSLAGALLLLVVVGVRSTPP